MIVLKSKVSIDGCRPEILIALITKIAPIFDSMGLDTVITSGTEIYKHTAKRSAHYRGDALDIRSKHFQRVKKETAVKLQKDLGDHFVVILEGLGNLTNTFIFITRHNIRLMNLPIMAKEWCSTRIARTLLYLTPFKKTLAELNYYTDFFSVDCRLHDNLIDAIDSGRVYTRLTKRRAYKEAHRHFRISMQKHIERDVHPIEQYEHEEWADRFYYAVVRFGWLHKLFK